MASQEDVFKQRGLMSPQRWEMSPKGQHFELGIAEMNLFLMLAALGPVALAVRRAAAAGRHALRSVHLPRPRCAELRLLPGRALHRRRHAVRHHAGAGRRRAPVDRHAADRHGAGRARLVRAGLRRRAGRHHGVGLRLHAARGRRGQGAALAPRREGRLGLSAPVDAAARPDRARHDAATCATTSSTAATGCAGPSPARELAIVYTGAVAPEAIEAAGPAGGGPPRRRRAGGDVGRPAVGRLACGAARARARRARRARARRGPAGGAAARCRPSSR